MNFFPRLEVDVPRMEVEGIAIFLIVLINAGIAAYTEKGANNALDALSKMTAPTCKVRDTVEARSRDRCFAV